jgi:hypothetical protein
MGIENRQALAREGREWGGGFFGIRVRQRTVALQREGEDTFVKNLSLLFKDTLQIHRIYYVGYGIIINLETNVKYIFT